MNEYDDSFDQELANLEIPTAPKVARLENKPAASTNEATNAATTTTNAKTPASANCVLVHGKQRGNPILKSIVNVPIEFRDDILADYVVGRTSCILYLSLKYHNLNPDYICQRLKTLGKQYDLRVLLVQVDTPVGFLHLLTTKFNKLFSRNHIMP